MINVGCNAAFPNQEDEQQSRDDENDMNETIDNYQINVDDVGFFSRLTATSNISKMVQQPSGRRFAMIISRTTLGPD